MKEYQIVLIITVILILGGIISAQFQEPLKFNFYKSELTISQDTVKEKLYYKPNKQYHTLFRTFLDPISYKPSLDNSIQIKKVTCSVGQAYFKTKSSECYDSNLQEITCQAYTEPNEYGCTFGDQYGFFKNNEYKIEAEYQINNLNIFLINGKKYIKFIVYSPDNHKSLTKNNFVVDSNLEIIKKDRYSSSENVIIYIPYNGSKELKITSKKEFEFDKSKDEILVYFLLILPALIFFLSWLIFGRERTYAEIPDQLSMMPDEKNKRKPWQVAVFFRPPFARADKNFFSATLLDFYNRKIIDIKEKDKKIYIKISKFAKTNENLDEIENMVLELLEIIDNKISGRFREGDYFSINNLSSDIFNLFFKLELRAFGKKLEKEIKKQSKEYVSTIGATIAQIIMFLALYPIFFMEMVFAIPLFIITLILIGQLSYRTAIFTRHKKEYYKEYQHWNSFRNYLKNSFTIRTGTHKTVIMWEDYLIYAAALGVPKRVIKELKAEGIITPEQENIYKGVYISSGSFATSSGASGGGHGGAGGGGVGGGGGGGR